MTEHRIVKRMGREASIWEARAGKILQYIGWKTRYMLAQRNRAIEVFLDGGSRGGHLPDEVECVINWHTIEQFTSQWSPGISATPEIRAALAYLFAQKYALVRGQMPHFTRALGLDSEDVSAAYQQLYDQPLDSLYVDSPPDGSPCETLPRVDWIDAKDLLMLQSAIERVHLESGKTLFQEGDQADCMYVISSGRVQVITQAGRESCLVTERGRDELIGEMAILTGEKRSATIIALRDTELYRFSNKTFEDMVTRYPRLTLHMTRTLARRLADAPRQARHAHPVATMAVLAAGLKMDVGDFSAALAQALSAHGTACHLTSREVNQQLGPDTAQAQQGSFDEMRLTSWLSDCEETHDFIVYETDAELTEWTRRCIRQADRLLLVGHAEGSPQLNALEEALFRSGELQAQSCKELVLLHENSKDCPAGTRPWLECRDVADHHHVTASNPAHMQRLARLLTGKPLCLVLSGGGVRGFLHIGVLRALREAGISADIIGGSSAGSIMASAAAFGFDDLELEEISRVYMKTASYLMSDYTLPVTSVIAGKRLDTFLKTLYGDTQIEDLWLKFFCTSVDLTDARLLVHRRGLLRKYVRASCSMPAVFPPVLDNQHLLVDGGLMNNIPIDPMLDIAPGGNVIAVNIAVDFYTANENFNYGADINLWKVINGRINPFAKKLIVPSIGNILLRSIEIGNKGLEAPQVAKANLYVPVSGGPPSVIGGGSQDEMIKIGYETTRDCLESEQGRALLAAIAKG